MHDPQDTVRGQLRARTAQVHTRLETLPVFQPILAGCAGWADYARLLRAYHVFYTRAWPNLYVGYRELRPLGAHDPEQEPLVILGEDFKALGLEPTGSPMYQASHADPARGVGWVWVAAGSALGARIIDRALDALFGTRREGRRFFEAAPDSGLRWKAICHSIEVYGSKQDVLERMIEGAQAAFGCIERSLTETYDDP